MKQLDFFNTTHEGGKELIERTATAINQEGAVMEMFQRYGKLSASQCWEHLNDTTRLTWVLTSVRRAITVLKNKGKLAKTTKKVVGIHSKNEYIYEQI